MQFLAHRGFWKTKKEQNTQSAIIHGLSNNFGIETDLRDFNGKLVISHDMPNFNTLRIETLLEKSKEIVVNQMFAFNIKSDGIVDLLRKIILKYDIKEYFVFDMSIPQTVAYKKANINFFIRQSEHERELSFYKDAKGIWLDCFNTDWFEVDLILEHLNNYKKVAIVSPELHEREYVNLWNKIKTKSILTNDDVYLCTDFPQEARNFFYE